LLGPDIQFLDTGAPVARQTRLRLPAAVPSHGCRSQFRGHVRLFTTGQPSALQAAAQRWLQLDGRVDLLQF
jgi:glutamate racemase